MKIILREHMDNLGDRGEIVNVAAGYARNYLLPKGLAYEATPGNLKQLNQQRRTFAARDAKETEAAQAIGDRIAALDLTTVHKAGETGTLYGSVTNADVAAMLAAKGIEVDRRRITVDSIKTVGDHEVQVKLHRNVVATLTIHVVAENTPAPVVEEPESVIDDETEGAAE